MNSIQELINQRVSEYYWLHDFNCAVTTLLILSEIMNLELNPQVLDAAVGMHGAGKYGAQCGLVEGSLMFIGLDGKRKGKSTASIVKDCCSFASQFEKQSGSLLCRELRPEGFKQDNPPHLCEKLTQRAVRFTFDFLSKTSQGD
ncbi:MAG: C-GCAxxG-C-C family protein [Bacillota bacterium]|jgi:hypothetical protein|nr:C-GCAxxG-C-C family protein [Bacillota bacterium]HHU29695.1 C_GCAxxG_C_C family protein [Bacillota bacterium]